MFAIDLNNLFDPINPSDGTKFNAPPTRREPGIRFSRMREMITMNKSTISHGAKRGVELSYVETIGTQAAQEGETHSLRWEQMICQLSNNAKNLISKANANVLINSGCTWDSKTNKWVALVNQCVDIEIMSSIDEDGTTMTPEKTLEYEALDTLQQNELEYKFQIETTDDSYAIFVAKKGSIDSIRTKARTMDNPVVVVKIGVPGHYTMALVYLKEKRIEFFDSGGTYDAVEFTPQGVPYSATLHRLRAARGHAADLDCVEGSYEMDTVVCKMFSELFPGFELVGINPGVNLQLDDRDAYCQTWVWLYIYLRFVYPNSNTRDTIEFLHSHLKGASKSKKIAPKAMELIEGWWNYLIYYKDSAVTSGKRKPSGKRKSGKHRGGSYKRRSRRRSSTRAR